MFSHNDLLSECLEGNVINYFFYIYSIYWDFIKKDDFLQVISHFVAIDDREKIGKINIDEYISNWNFH